MRAMRLRALALTFVFLAALFLVPRPFHVVSQDAAAQPQQTNTVNVQGNAFSPPNIIVLKGTTVTWINQDSIVHSVTSNDGQVEEFNRDPVGPSAIGATGLNRATVQFNTNGVIEYDCNYHDMPGTVTVVSSFDLPVINVEARDDNTFQPDYIEFNQSQNLSWTNVGQNTHNVVFEDDSIGKVGELPAGATVNFTLEAAGSFRYRCEYHSSNFEEGMVGKLLALNSTPEFPPTVEIASPQEGQAVTGTVNVTGSSAAGRDSPNVTAVEVRIGDGDWQPAAVSDGGNWTFTWDTTGVADGNRTLDARALAGELEGDIATVGVEVDNQADGGDGNATATATDEGDGTPFLAAPFVSLAVMVAAVVVRRRRE